MKRPTKPRPKKLSMRLKSAMEDLRSHFKPEFLNRVDEIITFHPLSEKQIRKIVNLQLMRVVERLKEQKITLTVTEEAKDWVGVKGFDPNLGARPLKRLIQSKLLDELAMQIIEKKINEGDNVEVNLNKDALAVTKV